MSNYEYMSKPKYNYRQGNGVNAAKQTLKEQDNSTQAETCCDCTSGNTHLKMEHVALGGLEVPQNKRNTL